VLKTVALVGNPNVGKTTIFNALTGLRQHVGNWPGVTVEKKEGIMEYREKEFLVVDLPGIYSLTAHSIDELIARNFILDGNADVIVDIVDSTCLMRNLFLTLELFEMEVKNIILVLNKFDLLKKKGAKIDIKKMRKELGVPVIPTNAKKGEGVEELKRMIALMAEGKVTTNPIIPRYDEDIEREIKHISELLRGTPLAEKYPIRWLALKLLQRDEEVIKLVLKYLGQEKMDEILKHISELEEKYKRPLDIVIASQKYEFLEQLLRKFVVHEPEVKENLANQLDRLLTHPVYGMISLLITFYLVFKFVFTFGFPLQELLDTAFSQLGESIAPYIGNEALRGLIVDGIIGGVGTVVSFFPLVFLLFVAMSILEDVGYLARIAAMMERFMRIFRLPGKAVIPMVLAFGCNVPAIMATRTIENEKERIITLLINPLVPCVARMTVITFLAGTFFPDRAPLVAIAIYAIAIGLALLSSLLLGKFIVKGEESPFIIELPEYLIPSWRVVLVHSWERSKEFLKKAATVILFGSILIWYLSSYPEPVGNGISYAERLGKIFEPLMKLMGLDWKAAVALLFGIIAKENTIVAYSIIYGVSEESLAGTLAGIMTPLQAFVLALVTTLYMPCIATLAAIRAEGGTKWMIMAALYNLLLATVIGIAVYQIGGIIYG